MPKTRLLTLVGLALVPAAAMLLLGAGTTSKLGRTTSPATTGGGGASATPKRFALRWGNSTSSHAVVSTTALAGETVAFAAVGHDGAILPSLVAGPPGVEPDGRGGWRYAPLAAPRIHDFEVTVEGTESPVLFRVFVAVPTERVRKGRLNGFVVGEYPAAAIVRGTPVEPPRGFIEVTAENSRTLVSPHFTLGQFLCKQPGEFPRYLVLDERLPLKLEALLARVRETGIEASTLAVMSGFRTPHYNHALGNVAYSRHVWGAAADVYVDEEPQDGQMDDLDRNGRVDRRDADFLALLAESLEASSDNPHLIGGIGRYDATAAHGPFVHVDVRSRSARW